MSQNILQRFQPGMCSDEILNLSDMTNFVFPDGSFKIEVDDIKNITSDGETITFVLYNGKKLTVQLSGGTSTDITVGDGIDNVAFENNKEIRTDASLINMEETGGSVPVVTVTDHIPSSGDSPGYYSYNGMVYKWDGTSSSYWGLSDETKVSDAIAVLNYLSYNIDMGFYKLT